MKLYKWALVEMAQQLKESRAMLDRTNQRVTRSLKCIENFEETSEKLSRIVGQPLRKA